MADLVTRLLLNSSQFDNNIRQSTQQVQQFQQIGRNITATIGKFAGALGVAMTAGEAFNKWIHSSQALGDEWDNTINACKGTIDVFFQSLSNGDWSAFQDGLFSTIKGLKELSALRDSLADAKLTMDFNTKRFEAQFTELEAIIRDKTKSLEERKKAFEQLQTLKADYKLDITNISAGNDKTLIQSLEARYKGYGWTTKDVEKYLSIYNNDFSSRPEKEALDEYKKKLSELESQQYSYTSYSSMYGVGTIRTENKEITKQIALFKAEHAELEKMRILNNDDDKDRAQMLKDYEYSYDLRKRAADFDKRVLELQASLQEGSTNKANKTAVVPVIPSGSIAELQSKLTGLKKSYENATSEGSRAGFMKAIKEAEIELQMMQLRASNFSLSGGGITSPAGRNAADDIKSGYIKVRPISTDSIKMNNDYADSLSAITTVMSSVTNMTNEGAAAWLGYSANIVSSVAAAIPALTSLTTALTAKAAAESAGSAAAVPVVGWINAVAAITAITAAMASIPKFATGGIVGGSSFTGDNMLARVNSGEMILNNRQQRNLFSLLNGGGSNNNSEVKLRIEGRDLVGVLNSQTNRTSKYK